MIEQPITVEETEPTVESMTLEDKLYLNRFKVDEKEPHIKLDAEKCAECRERFCIRCCPAGCYTEEEGRVSVSVDGCLECGTCSIACTEGAVDWRYPRGGFGVCYVSG